MSISLAFVAYPTAVESMPGANFWALLLGLTLFLLGVDSAFSMVEAAATVINDMPTYRETPRWKISLFLCILGFLLSIPFCTNWGIVLFDSIDHYMSNYLLLVVGVLQCLGCGWAFDYGHTASLGPNYARANNFLIGWYWVNLIVHGIWGIFTENGLLGMVVFVGSIVFIGLPVSYCISGVSFSQWYKHIFFCGVRRIGYSISKLGREVVVVDGKKTYPQPLWYEPAFVFYWASLVKYVIPGALWFLIMQALLTRSKSVYPSGYGAHWMGIGLIIPIVGLLAFFLNICCWVTEERLHEGEFTTELPGEENEFRESINQIVPVEKAIELADEKKAEP